VSPAADAQRTRLCDRADPIGEDVDANLGDRVHDLDEELRIPGLRNVIMADPKILRQCSLDRGKPLRHEVEIRDRHPALVCRAVGEAPLDRDPAGERDFALGEVRQEPREAGLEPLAFCHRKRHQSGLC
jgi:hypothetical protein